MPMSGVPPMIQPGRSPVAMPMAMPGPPGAGMNRYREMTLEELLLENRVVFLVGEINHVTANRVIMQMLYLQSVKKDRKSTRLNSSHANISYAVFCLKKKKRSPPPSPLSKRFPS